MEPIRLYGNFLYIHLGYFVYRHYLVYNLIDFIDLVVFINQISIYFIIDMTHDNFNCVFSRVFLQNLIRPLFKEV